MFSCHYKAFIILSLHVIVVSASLSLSEMSVKSIDSNEPVTVSRKRRTPQTTADVPEQKPNQDSESAVKPASSADSDSAAKPTSSADSVSAVKPKPNNTAAEPAGGETDIFENDKIDPFVGNKKWALFVKKMKIVSNTAMELMKNLTNTVPSLFSVANPFYVENREGYLRNFSMDYVTTTTIPLEAFFEPLHGELERSAVHTRINEAIGLTTIPLCMDLAKQSSTKLRDITRLKWVEINSLAVTVHHVFDRLHPVFTVGGLSEIEEAVSIEYPSWITETVIKETANVTYEPMTVDKLVEYIHTEMDKFGEKNHLIRGLERILRAELQGWDPRTTDRNIYCYGNNEFGVILDEFDILTEAALFLSLADVKYALIKMMREVEKQRKARLEAENGILETKTEVDFKDTFDQIIKEMTSRIEKKIKIVDTKDVTGADVIPGPLTFKCDLPPEPDIVGGPITSSADCPLGVYIQNSTLYTNGTPVALSSDPLNVVTLPDGKTVDCVRIVKRIVDGNGTIHPVPACTEEVLECKEVMIPVLVDEAGAPLYRHPNFRFPPTQQWGKVLVPPLGVSPAANATDPPLDLQAGPQNPNKTRGYLDYRSPSLNSSDQFQNAFTGYIESELVLSPEQSCAGTCAEYSRPTDTCTNKTSNCDLLRRSHCEKGQDCMKKSTCPTKARRCVRAAPKVTMCTSADVNSTKPYEWINIGGKQLGSGGCANGNDSAPVELTDPTKTNCSGEVMVARERWDIEAGVILRTPQYCELCLCICDDPINTASHYQFAIKPSEIPSEQSDTHVVSAIRFTRVDNVFALVTERGKLLENGEVDETTLEWDIFDKESIDEYNLVSLGAGPAAFKRIGLDMVTGEINEVVTRVRMNAKDGQLRLEASFLKLDENGRIIPGSVPMEREPFPAPKPIRTKVDMLEVCSPAHQRGPSQPFNVPKNSEYIEFDATSLEKDAGQAVVPFFDLQPIFSFYPTRRPFTSIGILYKSKRGSGGFLSPIATFWEKHFI